MHCMLISVDDVVSQSSLTKMLRELIESHSLSSSSTVITADGSGWEVLLLVVDLLLPFGTGRTSLLELGTMVVALEDDDDDEGRTL